MLNKIAAVLLLAIAATNASAQEKTLKIISSLPRTGSANA